MGCAKSKLLRDNEVTRLLLSGAMLELSKGLNHVVRIKSHSGDGPHMYKIRYEFYTSFDYANNTGIRTPHAPPSDYITLHINTIHVTPWPVCPILEWETTVLRALSQVQAQVRPCIVQMGSMHSKKE